MPLTLNIAVQDRATPVIHQLDAKLVGDAAKHSAGQSVMRQILDHLTALDEERPNALGGRRTHFYGKAGKSTSYETTDTGAMVSISSVGIAQRYFGGEIKPGPGKKYLTIPARAEAHGRRAGEFNNLQILFGRNGPYALAERDSMELRRRRMTKRKGGVKAVRRWFAHGAEPGGGIFFWLVKSVTQQPDPTVLPEVSAMEETAMSAVSYLINSFLNESRVNS